MNIAPADMEKPKIAVINTSNTLSSCYIHLDAICEKVMDAIREAGGLPFEVRTVAPSDFVTSAGRKARYLMPTRDLIVNEIECMIEGAVLDGMVCLSSCDKTTPAHLMAAARLNVPSMILTCGYQVGGHCDGCGSLGGQAETDEPPFVDIDDVYEQIGAVETGKMTFDQLEAMTESAIQSPGVCAGLGTANSMHIVAEAMGMTLPGNAPIWASSDQLNELAAASGKRIVDLVKDQLLPRDIITEGAIDNAIMSVLAVGGSVNTVRHISAVATEAELPIDVIARFEALAEKVKLITSVRPNGPHRTEDLDAAGGIRAVLEKIRSSLNTECLTVNGNTIGDNIAGATVKDDRVIKDLDNPVSQKPGIGIFRGNLAPDGSIVKLSAVPGAIKVFTGPANIFEGEDEAIAALGEGKISKGDVIILRNMGVKGGPGTVFAASFVAALNGAEMASHVAVVTDGELSGLNRGIIVGQIMPEAADGGPLAVVEQGEIITIDTENRHLHLEVPDAVIAERLSTWRPPEFGQANSWLTQYAQLVQPIARGAVLGKRDVFDRIKK